VAALVRAKLRIRSTKAMKLCSIPQPERPWTNDVETYIANLMEEIYSDLADDG
jgi:hypothetical protein